MPTPRIPFLIRLLALQDELDAMVERFGNVDCYHVNSAILTIAARTHGKPKPVALLHKIADGYEQDAAMQERIAATGASPDLWRAYARIITECAAVVRDFANT